MKLDRQDVRIVRKNPADDSSNNHLSKADNVMFAEQENNGTVAALKLCATSETLTKQKKE